MLTNSDKERINNIMEEVMQKRLLRTSPPERDEEKIAEILRRAEQSTADEHDLLIQSRNEIGGYVGNTNHQEEVTKSDEPTKFTQMARLKKRFKKQDEES